MRYFSRRQTGGENEHESSRSALRWPLWAGLATAALVMAGCGDDDEPVTAERSQFRVEGDDAGDSSSGPAPRPGDASDPDPGVTGQPPTIPRRDLTTPPSGSPTELATELNDINRELQMLQAQRVPPERQQEVLDQFRSLCERKIEVADRLYETSDDEDLRYIAANERLGTMRILVQLGVSEDFGEQLQSFCQKLTEDESTRISMLGQVVLFGMQLGELATGRSEDVDAMREELRGLLADEGRELSVLEVSQQAVNVLREMNRPEDAQAVIDEIKTAFEDHEDESVQRELRNFVQHEALIALDFDRKLLALFQGDDSALPELMDAARTALESEQPGSVILRRVTDLIAGCEQTSHIQEGAELSDLVTEVYANHADAELAAFAEQTAELPIYQRFAMIGEPVEIEGKQLGGEDFDWSAYEGKTVLLFFWATMAEECVAEFDNLAENLAAYREQGFEVLGINLDRDEAAIEAFLAERALPWDSVYQCDLAFRSGIEAIPFTFLVDENGVVIDMHVLGDRLDSRLAEHFGAEEVGSPDPATGEESGDDSGTATEEEADGDATDTGDGEPPETEGTDDGAGSDDGGSDPGSPDQAMLRLRGNAPHPADAAFVSTGLRQERGQRESEESDSTDNGGTGTGEAGQDAPGEEATESEEEWELPEGDQNPYLAPATHSTFELFEYLLEMQEWPETIRRRGGYLEAVVDTADRIIDADATNDRLRGVAMLSKLQLLHEAVCAGEEQAEPWLEEAVSRSATIEHAGVAQELEFLNWERQVLDGVMVPVEDVPDLLTGLLEYLAGQRLEERHRRLASSTVSVINRLPDDAEREEWFGQFGRIFAQSRDTDLARYGRRLATPVGESASSPLIGQPLALEGTTALGTPFDWDAYRGKVVLVDFWATWCGPCVQEIPHVKAMHDRHADAGLEVVQVNLDRDPAALAAFMEQHQITWPNLVGDEASELARRYGVRGIPTIMLVDRDGRVLAVSHSVDALAEQVAAALEP